MTVASEVHVTLQSMGFVQLLLALGFLTSYAVACSALFESLGRWRGAATALVTGVGFVTVTDPWVNGAMLLACAVGGMGLFSATTWLMARVMGLADSRAPASTDPLPPVAEASPVAAAPHTLPRDGVHAT
jgi:hypothetical protein